MNNHYHIQYIHNNSILNKRSGFVIEMSCGEVAREHFKDVVP
jgi:hypothetical protein